jgi:hypothetical protein
MRAIADILPNNESCYESSDRDSGAQSCSGYASAKEQRLKKKDNNDLGFTITQKKW